MAEKPRNTALTVEIGDKSGKEKRGNIQHSPMQPATDRVTRAATIAAKEAAETELQKQNAILETLRQENIIMKKTKVM